jgi:hypothetical protein
MGAADDIKDLYDEGKKAVMGDDNHIGAAGIRVIKRHAVPNIFWAKPIVNHYLFDQLQEMASPGYNAKLAKRMEKSSGFDYWWRPGDVAPDHLPRFTQ